MSDQVRGALSGAKRLVVKIGSRSLLGGEGGRFASLAAQTTEQVEAGRSLVLVSSGAVKIGRDRLGLDQRPRDMARLQAAAAAGQTALMHGYEEAFKPHGLIAAQLLLTHADLTDRDRYLNARAAIDALLELGAVPVINENDTVSFEEIQFGDNDQLAAMVATLCGADLLVLLTDVRGLLDEKGERVPVVDDIAKAAALVRPPEDDVGLGGMASKVEVLAGDDVGTLFMPHGSGMASRKHWIAFTLKPRGVVLVDAGAARAVAEGKRSLLPAGVVGVRGDFEPGDAVRIVGPDGAEVARGLARYGTRDVSRLAGARTADIEGRIGRHAGDEIVHRDDLVVA
jgi:glutamate 5-kinase